MRTILGFAWAAWAMVWGLCAASVVGTLLVLPFVVVPSGRRERYTMRAAQLWARLCLIGLLARPRVTGASGLGDEGGALFLCNHRSWLDPLLLIAHTRSNGLSKAQIFWIPFVGLYGWLTGAVFFRRSSKKQRQRARDRVLWLLRAGHRIQVFPEGTRSRDGRLREKVFLRLAKDCFAAGLPVVPCAVYATERTLPPGRPLAFPLQPSRLHVCPARHPRDHTDADAFAEACWADVRAEVARLEAEDRSQAAAA